MSAYGFVYKDNDGPCFCVSSKMGKHKRQYAKASLSELVIRMCLPISVSLEEGSWSCVAPLVFIQRET